MHRKYKLPEPLIVRKWTSWIIIAKEGRREAHETELKKASRNSRLLFSKTVYFCFLCQLAKNDFTEWVAKVVSVL